MESDPKNPEDIKGRGADPTVEDHAIDEQKLGIFAMFKPYMKPKPQPVGRPSMAAMAGVSSGRTKF